VAKSRQTAQSFGRRTFQLAVAAGGAFVAAATAAGVVLAASSRPELIVRKTVKDAPPAARVVETDFVDVANAHSAAIGSTAKIGKASCVQGDPGSYACSFVRAAPPKPSVCAVAILKWTPGSLSTYSVQTTGRVPLAPSQCGPVQKVLHVLGNS